MKRPSTKTKNDIHPHYSLFSWKPCTFCKQEFRRERGYSWLVQGRFLSYACSSCCSSEQGCQDKIDRRWEYVKANKPKAPAAPPKKR